MGDRPLVEEQGSGQPSTDVTLSLVCDVQLSSSAAVLFTSFKKRRPKMLIGTMRLDAMGIPSAGLDLDS